MPHRHNSLLVPRVQKRTADAIVRTLKSGEPQCRAAFSARIAKLGLPAATQESLRSLFGFLLGRLDTALADESDFKDRFQEEILACQPHVSAADIILLLQHWEELVVSVLWQDANVADAEAAFVWVHTVASALSRSVVEHLYIPVKIADEAVETGEGRALERLLNRIAPGRRWQWLALVQTGPNLRVRSVAVYDDAVNGWSEANRPSEWQDTVAEVLRQDATFMVPVDERVCVVAKADADPLSVVLLRQVAFWLRTAGKLLGNGSDGTIQGGLADVHDVLLDFDDVLFCARDLADIFEVTVTYVCRIANFERGALFLYNPLTYSAEGVYGHNLDVDEIMRIHESERSIPVLQWAMHVSRPAFYEDVTSALPEHYVRRFELKSLFVCPIPGPTEHPMGALLLDQAGKPFRVDEYTTSLVSHLLTRVGKVLQWRMYESLPTRATGGQRSVTQRERQVLQSIADGCDTKETGMRLHISEHTVREYVSSILRKLQAKNRTEAVAKGIREGIIQ